MTLLKRLGQVAGVRHASACATILRLHALLYQVACATILGCVRYYIRLPAPPQYVHQYIVISLQRLGQVAGARHASACATILRLSALLYQVACAAILGCVRYYIWLRVLLYQVACSTLVHALVYCNFLKDVRLGGWGLRGRRPRHQADTQVHALLYLGCVRYYTCMRHISACTSIL